jgi:hypothetical protein
VERKQSTFSLKEILPDIIAKFSAGNMSDQVKLEQAWSTLAGREADKVLFDGFREGTLFIRVDNVARRFIWQGRRGELIRKLQQVSPDVKQIVFRIRKEQ